jgi:hypothetical protein
MKNLVIGLLIAIMTTSCCVYNPQTIDIPLITQKHDLRLDAGISIIPSANATISYGLTNKIALQVFGTIGSDERYYFQIAPGIYKTFKHQTVGEIFAGIGYGHGNAYRDANPGNMFGNYQIYLVQYNFGKYDSKFLKMDYGFGLKMGYFHSDLTDQNYYRFYSENGPFASYDEKSFLIEPLAFARFGGEKLKFNIKVGFCKVFKITNTDKYIPTEPLNIGLGLNYLIKSKKINHK